MEINGPRIRDAAGRVRRVGDDADLYLERVAGQMAAKLQQNRGLASTAALKQVVDHLKGHTKGLANISHIMSDNLSRAVDNHELNEIRKARVFSSLRPGDAEERD